MSEQTAHSESVEPDSWLAAAEKFIDEAREALGDRFAPQLKALRELARNLDESDRYEPSRADEYARMHRWLLNKTASPKAGREADDGPDLLDMLANNPGVRWNPDA